MKLYRFFLCIFIDVYIVLEAKTTTLLEAMKLAANTSFQIVQFETDSKILVAAVNSSCAHINEFGDIVS